MRVDEFDYDLPDDLIALRPAEPREAARLLVVEHDRLVDRTVADLPDLFRPGDLLVFNDTRVFPARLRGVRSRAGQDVAVELLLHRPAGAGRWTAFARPGKRLRPGDRIAFADGSGATLVEKLADGEALLAFEGDALALAEAHGEIPLPPYIESRRATDARDRADYQNVYARETGSVAAPTAGFHFTDTLLDRLARRGVERTFVTLHVGAGTFQPVKVERTEDHVMHRETFQVSAAAAAAIAAARTRGGRVIAVGTTAMRTLESAARDDGEVQAMAGDTGLFITPGYRFRVADLMVTNFHLPRSTLMMLIAAFSGLERVRAAYAHAVAQRYRFYSYGDACLLARA